VLRYQVQLLLILNWCANFVVNFGTHHI